MHLTRSGGRRSELSCSIGSCKGGPSAFGWVGNGLCCGCFGGVCLYLVSSLSMYLGVDKLTVCVL